ncbi:hypothetical protein [Gemella haemolysans]|uniref:Uncharacterized protein n=2 Tax=Gemella haemolysans TaxID=1379 RepID=A0AA87DRP1_9BACL|nr:hypothetical protein [Gemella haemolysans]EGF88492.1 hypothetical protein HMPREF0428_01010 [Gemella haemolysans M341]QIX88347.1 hypothetical protein FOC48_06020 [Gemella haemolysans]DAD61501.1 MAG TPA: hypothetical protein [Caudoviricetes sp.]
MQVTIDKDILELLDSLNVSEDKLESTINILLIEGIDSITSNEIFIESEKKKDLIKLKVMELKLKYMRKTIEILNNDY